MNNQDSPSLTTAPLKKTIITGMYSSFTIKKQMMMALTETLDKVTA